MADLLVAGAKCRRDVGRCRTVASLPLLPRPLALLPAPRPTQLRTPLWIFLPALPLLPSWPLTLHPQASSPGGGEHVRVTHPVLWFMGLGGGAISQLPTKPPPTQRRGCRARVSLCPGPWWASTLCFLSPKQNHRFQRPQLLWPGRPLPLDVWTRTGNKRRVAALLPAAPPSRLHQEWKSQPLLPGREPQACTAWPSRGSCGAHSRLTSPSGLQL